MNDCDRFQIALACAALAASPAVAQEQPRGIDEAVIGQLARLLEQTDTRTFDGPLVRELLGHPLPVVRRQAALAAGRVGEGAAVDLLIPALADTAEPVAAAAAFALGLLGDARGVQALVGATRTDERAAVQAEAVAALAKIGGQPAAGALREVLQSGRGATAPSPAVRAALLEAWRLGGLTPIDDVLPYAESADLATRWRALYTLGRLQRRTAAPALLGALDDREPSVRAVAARAVTRALADSARLDPRALANRLRALLDERDPLLRITVLRSLASLGDSGLVPAVAPLVADADLGVAVQAETTLGVLAGAAALQALRPRLSHATFAIRRQAVIAVAQVGRGSDSADAAALAALAGDADWRWRLVAAEAYAAAGLRGLLEGLSGDADGRVAAQALQGLGRVVAAADSGLLARARRALRNPDPVVRSVAADLLGRAPSPDDVVLLVEAYRAAAGDPISDARLSAVAALAEIARASGTGRLAVASRFLEALPRPDDHLVHRLAVERLADAAGVWGAPRIGPGRAAGYYRDVARRWLAPVLAGGAAPRITIDTDRGALVVELLPADAPLTVAAFLELVERRFFDGHRWHRVVPGFVAQDGDPRGDGWGGPGFALRDEVNPVRYGVGTMGMALSGPDTGGSQFFLTHGPQPHLDGTYTAFGRVVAGHGVLAGIAQGDRIRSIYR